MLEMPSTPSWPLLPRCRYASAEKLDSNFGELLCFDANPTWLLLPTLDCDNPGPPKIFESGAPFLWASFSHRSGLLSPGFLDRTGSGDCAWRHMLRVLAARSTPKTGFPILRMSYFVFLAFTSWTVLFRYTWILFAPEAFSG
jgi:hypothetical protein